MIRFPIKLKWRSAVPRTPWDHDVICVRVRSLELLGLFLGMAGFGTLSALCALAWWTDRYAEDGVGMLFIAIVVGVTAAVMLGYLAMRVHRRWRLRRHLAGRARRASSRLMNRRTIEALVNLRALENPIRLLRPRAWQGGRVFRQMDRYCLPLPCTIVGVKVKPYLRHVTRTLELVDPEVVAGRVEVRELKMLFLLVVLTFAFWLGVLIGLSWLRVFLLISAFSAVVYALQLVFRLLSGAMRQSRGLIVGPGAIASHNRLWRREDAVTVALHSGSVIQVDIITPSGNLSLQFSDRSEGFREFWQRWMHPRPRPEMVSQAAQG